MRPNIHNVLYRQAPVALAVLGSIFIVTLPVVPFSYVYLSISIIVGLLDSVISIDEITGGHFFSWLSLPLLMAGQIVAAYFGGVNADSWRLILQFIVLVYSVELAVVIVFRATLSALLRQNVSIEDAEQILGLERRGRNFGLRIADCELNDSRRRVNSDVVRLTPLMRATIIAIAFFWLTPSLAAQPAPRFEDYPARTYTGTIHRPKWIRYVTVQSGVMTQTNSSAHRTSILRDSTLSPFTAAERSAGITR
jgi:hypothetical protein